METESWNKGCINNIFYWLEYILTAPVTFHLLLEYAKRTNLAGKLQCQVGRMCKTYRGTRKIINLKTWYDLLSCFRVREASFKPDQTLKHLELQHTKPAQPTPTFPIVIIYCDNSSSQIYTFKGGALSTAWAFEVICKDIYHQMGSDGISRHTLMLGRLYSLRNQIPKDLWN